VAVKIVVHAVGVAATTPNATHPAALAEVHLLGVHNLTASPERPRIAVAAAASANGSLPFASDDSWSDPASEPVLILDFAQATELAGYKLYASTAHPPTQTAPVSWSLYRKPGAAAAEGRRLMTLTAPDDEEWIFEHTITVDAPVVLVPHGLIGGQTNLLEGFQPPSSPPVDFPGRWASCTCPAFSPSEPPAPPPSPPPPSPPTAPPSPSPPPFPPPVRAARTP